MNGQNRVKIKVSKNSDLFLEITDKVIQDYMECKSLSEKRDCDGKDCSTCSLDTYGDFNFGLCELPVVVDAIEGRCSHEQTEV